jgi:anti-sigma B factor antagonist
MGTGGFSFETEIRGATVVASLAGELDMAATFRIEPELERLTREAGVRMLVVDMARVEFMDSSVLGLLLATQRRLEAEGIRFLLTNPSDSVRRILSLTGAGEALPVGTPPPDA